MTEKRAKKKPIKMALTDFLASTPSTSWADEVLELPTAPASSYSDTVEERRSTSNDRYGSNDRHNSHDRHSSNDRYGDRYSDRYGGNREDGRRGSYNHRPERFHREPRPPVPLPDRPPFTAYVGNLPFDSNEDMIRDFFSGLPVENVRLIRDHNGRTKGFCYVEFADRDALAAAVERDGQTLENRTLRVNVAEPPKERPVREDRNHVDSWRRNTPVQSPRRSEFGDRHERPRSSFSNRRPDHEQNQPTRADLATTWRRQEPLPPSSPNMHSERRRGWGFNSHSSEDRPLSGGYRHRHDDFEGVRSPSNISRRTSVDSRGSAFGAGGDSPNMGQPRERKRLELLPRTKPLNSNIPEVAPRTSRVNPFGDAKPRDENEMQRRVEERRRLRELEEQKRKEAENQTSNGTQTATTEEVETK